MGVSGLTLDGGGSYPFATTLAAYLFRVAGYSFMSGQYGLSIDNMAGYEFVMPNGTITNATSSNKDLCSHFG
jgi:hypothetical protein